MRLIYPLTVNFVDVELQPNRRRQRSRRRATRSVVRIKCLSVGCIASTDQIKRRDAAAAGVVNAYVIDETLDVAWPHYFYVLVAKDHEQRNLSMLHWFTVQALHQFKLQQRVVYRGKSVSLAAAANGLLTGDNEIGDVLLPCEYELVLYDVDSSITSMYDEFSVLDRDTDPDGGSRDYFPSSPTKKKRKRRHYDSDDRRKQQRLSRHGRGRSEGGRGGSGGECEDGSGAGVGAGSSTNCSSHGFTRANNLYRLRLQSLGEYRYLFQFFSDNAHYWQSSFSVPSNLLYDHFRFALDIYVANLRFKTTREQMEKAGREEMCSSVAGLGQGGNEVYRRIMKKWSGGTLRGSLDAFRYDRLELRRWFACGKWCLFDVDRGCMSCVPADEFDWCVRSVLGLTDQQASEEFVRLLYETPLNLMPRVVWDIETIARGKGTIPRGVTADQKLSSVAVVYERPALDAGRLVVLWVLAPDHMTEEEIERLTVIPIGDTSEKKSEKPQTREDLKVGKVVVHAYRDERALLTDFLMDMFVNRSLLVEFFGVKPASCEAYQDLATLLVGYNSIEYDYAFLLDRCLYFGTREFVPATCALRRFSSLARPTCASYVFHEAQYCLDMMQFLQARNRQLKSYKLSAVLKVYNCDIEKIDFSAVEIRRLYYPTIDGGIGHSHDVDQQSPHSLRFLDFVLRYNVYDCLSLCDLLDRTSFASHMTVMMRYFYAPLDHVVYKGNSSLLPTLIQLENLQDKREFVVLRQPQHNNFLCSLDDVELSVYTANAIELDRRFRVKFLMERIPRSVCTNHANPYNVLLTYHRLLAMFFAGQPSSSQSQLPPPMSRVSPRLLYDGRVSFVATNEMELLRVGEKNYIGGMNYADPGHAKFPILMDYNSFYPSIIRSYRLDVCTVAVLSLKQILLTVPIPLLECLLHSRVLRFFDYTSLDDLGYCVDTERHLRLLSGDPWHEAYEYRTIEQVVLTSRHLDRKFLLLVYRYAPSTIDSIVTNALRRRAVWKRRKKENPQDVVVQFMELMEKLLANSLYGYMNFSLSAIFSRATAASVTLLCRHAFCRTRRIIESKELLATTLLDPNAYRFRVVYIDTDGCIFVLSSIGSDGKPTSITADTSTVDRPWFQLYADIPPHDTVRAYDRLTDTINRMLNFRHVTLAAEHYDSIAVSVFATKKYVLLKMPGGKVKCTGFESNAARPIRELYDVVLRNVLRAFHIYQLVPESRFIATIRHHRLFFFAVFDYVYERWLEAVAAAGTNRRGKYGPQDFGLNRPLNVKATKGEMSTFIDRVLYQFQYSPGERVWILKVLDEQRAVEDRTLYPSRGKFILIEELETDGRHGDDRAATTVVPNLKFYIGGYMRYLYQCVESHQTLRESSRVTREPIEPGYYLDSFQSIYNYCWACWLYVRVAAKRFGDRVDGVWWASDTESAAAKQKRIHGSGGGSVDAATMLQRLPKYLPRSFFRDKFIRKEDNPVYRALFCDLGLGDEEDRRRKTELLRSNDAIVIQRCD